MLSAKKSKEVKGDIMNVKRTKQEKEQFSSQNSSSYIYGKNFKSQSPNRTPDMNEKEKRQGTLIFFIVESLLTAFAFKIFKRQAGKAWVKSPIFLPNSYIQPSSHSTKNPSSAFIIIKISFSCSRIHPAVYKATQQSGNKERENT